jgi:hypothetical protein
MNDKPVSVEQIREFLALGRDHCEQQCRIELWGVLSLLLGAAGSVEEQERSTAARIVRSAYVALHLTATWEPEMVPLFEAAMLDLPKPDHDVRLPSVGENAAFHGLATIIVNLARARRGETAAAEAWWRLYPHEPPPWRLTPEEQARQQLPN